MTKREFLRRRRPLWREFERRVAAFDRTSLRKRTAEEVTELSRGLREVAADLAAVRSRGWGEDLAAHLNALVARGHAVFYTGTAAPTSAVVRYLAEDFPRLFRANVNYFAAACALFFVPFAAAWAAVVAHPPAAERILDPTARGAMDAMYGPGGMAEKQFSHRNGAGEPADGPGDGEPLRGEDGGEVDPEDAPVPFAGFAEERTAMFGFYVRNNVGIALRCFALGITLGLGTAWTLLSNGLVLGAATGYVQSRGNGEAFFSFVVGHGAFELTAIAVAGGAGLMLADALLHPGDRTRRDALRVRGLDAVQIAAGAAAMLVVAAFLEAYWSPGPFPAAIKFAVGAGLWVTVALYLSLAGRGTPLSRRRQAARPGNARRLSATAKRGGGEG